MCSKILTTISALLFTLSSYAQMGTFYNPDRQLSSSMVSQVYLDHNGFLWVATRDGLNRYDGYQFRVYRRENPVDSTLKTNMVNAIVQEVMSDSTNRRITVMPAEEEKKKRSKKQ